MSYKAQLKRCWESAGMRLLKTSMPVGLFLISYSAM